MARDAQRHDRASSRAGAPTRSRSTATALNAATVRAHFEAGRDTTDGRRAGRSRGRSPRPRASAASSSTGATSRRADLDGYDVFRATSAAGPFTRVNACAAGARRRYVDTSVVGGTDLRLRGHRERHRQQPQRAVGAGLGDAAVDRRTCCAATRRSCATRAQESVLRRLRRRDDRQLRRRLAHRTTSSRQRHADRRREPGRPAAEPLARRSSATRRTRTAGPRRRRTTSTRRTRIYQQDAQRMRAAGYGDRVYGRAITTGGRTWLQYWLFSYYNPQNVLGFGVHEGDWEFAQVAPRRRRRPDVATYAQHGGGERCAWSQVRRDAGRRARRLRRARLARLVLRAGRRTRAGCSPTTTTAAAATSVRRSSRSSRRRRRSWPGAGSWGASSSSPVAPRRQGKWDDAERRSARTPARARSARRSSAATARAQDADVAAPAITAEHAGARAERPTTASGRAARSVPRRSS